MEDHITISEAKNKLPAIVHQVEKGPSVTLTRHGRPVAVLLSIREYETLNRSRPGFWDVVTEFREQNKDRLLSGDEFENLRDRSPGREVDLS